MSTIPVKTRTVLDTGRMYEKVYSHPEKEFLISYMADVKKSIDSMRSPSVSTPVYYNGEWQCNLTYYGLD